MSLENKQKEEEEQKKREMLEKERKEEDARKNRELLEQHKREEEEKQRSLEIQQREQEEREAYRQQVWNRYDIKKLVKLNSFTTIYRGLGVNVPPWLNIEQVRKLYKTISLEWHPDKTFNLPVREQDETAVKLRVLNRVKYRLYDPDILP
ncbi:DDRGK domain-containing protein 1-like [Papaver somniferum]|nr:DDRGK domain-containing protein 1-like [Papaver somniferum]